MQRKCEPLTNTEIGELDACLASIHEPLQPMDACALDGFLCGVLLQPVTISPRDWLPLVLDIEGRAVPEDAQTRRIAELAQRRCAELDEAISRRAWFDPWIFEPDDDDVSPVAAQLPWVAGFAAALETFPQLLEREDEALLEPLAVLYAAFDPQDLDDAEDLLPIIETLEPPLTMADAAEDLVRSVLLLADVTRPRQVRPVSRPGPARPGRTGARRPRGAR
jgi:uncharacterized protein